MSEHSINEMIEAAIARINEEDEDTDLLALGLGENASICAGAALHPEHPDALVPVLMLKVPLDDEPDKQIMLTFNSPGPLMALYTALAQLQVQSTFLPMLGGPTPDALVGHLKKAAARAREAAGEKGDDAPHLN